MAESGEQTPSYLELFRSIHMSVNEFGLKWDKYPPNYPSIKRRFTAIYAQDIASVFLLAFLYTLCRIMVTKFFSVPLGRWLQLRKPDLIKFPESVWKALVYTVLWSYCLYVVVVSGRYDYFQKPCRVMNFTLETLTRPPQDIYTLYICQIGFYLHGLYATLYMDVWRKDSAAMMFHHFLTIFLLYFSFCMSYYAIGALVLLLHDISDILLEITKTNVYLKSRGGKRHKINDHLATIGFASFALSWALCRLYWYPLKVIYAANRGVYLYHYNKDPQMYIPFNIMLLLLQILHIYWFIFIIIFLYKVATGQISDVEDTREYEEEEEEVNLDDKNNCNSTQREKKNL